MQAAKIFQHRPSLKIFSIELFRLGSSIVLFSLALPEEGSRLYITSLNLLFTQRKLITLQICYDFLLWLTWKLIQLDGLQKLKNGSRG